MDYKGPPQYATPGQNGTPAPQYSSPQPQYGQPVPPQQYAQPVPAQQYVPVDVHQQQQQQQQQQQYVHPQQPHPAYAQPQQHAVSPAPAVAPAAAPAPVQYQPQAPMQRAVAAPAGDNWSSSLLDCSPCDSCLLGTFLPCILIGQTSDRMRDPSMATADALNSDCLLFTAIQCFTGCGWIHVMMKRGEIRQRFGIAGGGSDCCATYWCACCALIQQDKEVKLRTAGAAGPVTHGYQAPAGMQMPQK